jgi:hypothetical protein
MFTPEEAIDGAIAAEMCARVSLLRAEDPIGMASGYDRLLLIELPTPWSDGVPEDRLPESLRAAVEQTNAAGTRTRILAIAPDPAYSKPDHSWLIDLRRPAEPFAAYHKYDHHVPTSDVLDLAESLLADRSEAGAESSTVRDLLVCTHGTVDACCAKFGYPMFKQLREAYGDDPAIRVWRCSHFGGHRFAATLVDLPDLRWYAYLTPGMLQTLVRRTGDVAALRRHYRGWGGTRSVFEQVVERECWMREGWNWLQYRVAGRVLAIDPDGSREQYPQFEADAPRWAEVRIDYAAPDGSTSGTYLARVETDRTVEVGGCGEEAGPVHQYHVTRIEQITPH